MGAIAEAVSGLVSGAADIGFGIYDRDYQARMNARDFDYQKSLQQQIFQREDTAVQRRMADLKAAGLNPNLAAGSAAGAGSVVGRSSTPGLPSVGNPVGTALDSAAAVAQLRAQHKQNQILNNQVSESAAKANIAENEAMLNNIDLYNMLGIDSQLRIKNNRLSVKPQLSINTAGQWEHADFGKDSFTYKVLDSDNSRIMNYLNWQYLNNKNSADLLQRDVDWYTADKIGQYLGIGASIFSGAGAGYRAFRGRK